MLYKSFLFLLGFIVLDIAAVPADMLPPEGHGKSQTQKQNGDEGVVHLPDEMSLPDLVKTMSEINGEVYVIDGTVRPAEINIISADGLTEEELTDLFATILRVNNLALIKADGVNKIVNSRDAARRATPVRTGSGG
jgi:type II secretory pathway component GspD/PulD (secretin)